MRMTQQHTVTVGPVRLSNTLQLGIIAGTCQLETREHALEI